MTRIPIFLASDNNYAPFVATTMVSACDNTKCFLEFYILSDGISKENQNIIDSLHKNFSNFSVEFLQIDSQNLFKSFKTAPSITLSTYNRFLIPQLKPNIDRALYSDVDVIVLGDISEMYNENLNGYALGAIWEEYAENNDNEIRRNALNYSSQHKYFSAGNLLIDCKQWREQNITEKLFDIEREYRDKLLYADQDVLNIAFDNNYKQLAKKYCYIAQDFFFYKEHDILIRHFNGPIKPWRISPETKTTLIPNIEDFWRYAKMTPYYDEIYQKTQQDKEEQKLLLRHLQILALSRKTRK